ncbi:MAG: GEVED domain-containing protein, partial [Flavobacteriales bacterium]
PAGATLGNTRLRVRNVYHNQGEPNPTEPCYNYAFGETEDYGITIQNAGGSGPCIPTSAGGTSDGDYINRVALGTINNANSGGVGVPTYTDFSSNFSTALTRGTPYILTVQGGTFNDDNVAAWIDYDQDDTFEAGEKLGEVAITVANQTVTISFTVPAGATLGTTTLRVRNVYHNQGEPNPTDPCFSYAFGETEDYGITIQNASGSGPCVPTSANGPADGDFVNTVILNTIVNGDTGGETGPTYIDYSSNFSTTLVRNGYYGIIIESGTYTTDSYAVWIDYDQDDVFEASEKLGQFSTTEANESQLISFEVPVNAPLGNTTMRVRGVFISTGEPAEVEPCFNYSYGETEDYGITIAPAPSVYCTPVNVLGPIDGDFIDDVVLGNIVNLNTGGTEGPAYTDYSANFSTNLERGSEYTLVIGSGEYTPDVYAAWIDMNLDGVFEASESLGQFTNTAAGSSGELTFTVPLNASIGESRLRIRGQFITQNEPDPIEPCYAYLYGETEDYKVFIQFSTGLTDEASAEVSLWPNPTNGLVNVSLGRDASAMITVLDMQGRLVQTTSTTGRSHTLDVTGLAAGTYLVRVEQEGVITNRRIEVLKP